jgi:nucleotide-binding universal stress UspA family protein
MNYILLATDGSPTANNATETAIDYAKAFDAPLLVVSVWDVTYEPIGIAYGPAIPDLDHVGHAQAQKVVEAAALKAEEAGVECETVIRRGTPVQQICAIADKYDAMLIVLGSHGWGPFKRALFGSVSTGVLHHAKQPVLVVRSQEPAETQSADREAKVRLVT